MRMFLTLFLAGAVVAQQPTPTIRVTTRLVTVNVIVREKGKPAADLAAGDFQVFDNGKPQKIAFFSMTGQVQRTEPVAKREPNTFSNRTTSSGEKPTSATVLLLDGLNTERPDQTFAGDQVLRFLRQINPEEKIAIYTLGRHLKVLHDFTDDRDHLARFVSRYRGENVPGEHALNVSEMFDLEADDEMAKDNEKEKDFSTQVRIRTTLAAFEAIANHVSRVPGRKNLIWVTGSFPIYPGFKVTTGMYETSREHNFSPEIARMSRWFSDANVAVYPVDARGMFSPFKYGADTNRNPARLREASLKKPFAPDNFDVLRTIAQQTGGVPYYNTNDLSNALQRAVADAEITYTLGFYPEPATPDGKFHQIEVKVSRKGTDVRHRNGYYATETQVPNGGERDLAVRDALASPLEASSIELNVQADPSPKGLELVIGINPAPFSLEPKQDHWVGELRVILAQFDERGKVLEATADTLNMDVTQERYKSIRDKWLLLRRTVQTKPGAFQYRVIVQDSSSGMIGSVHVPLSKLAR